MVDGGRFEVEVQKLIKREVQHLANLSLRNRGEVAQVLQSQFGRTLYYVSADDERRLLRLSVWAEKYKLTIGYILGVLVPYYQQRFKSRRTKQGHQLPVAIPTLTGKAAEWVLKQQMERDFPNGENKTLWAQAQRRVLLQMRDENRNGEDDGITVKHKRLLDFEWPSRYVKHYRRKVREARKELSPGKVTSQKPYRNNPWL